MATDADEDGDVDTGDLSQLSFDNGKCWVPADDPLVSQRRLESARGSERSNDSLPPWFTDELINACLPTCRPAYLRLGGRPAGRDSLTH